MRLAPFNAAPTPALSLGKIREEHLTRASRRPNGPIIFLFVAEFARVRKLTESETNKNEIDAYSLTPKTLHLKPS
jgi:hypothetical protein